MNLILILEFNLWNVYNTLIWLDKHKSDFSQLSYKEARAQLSFEILSLNE